MARFSPAFTNFNAGEWGPRTYGRVDLQKYLSSQRLCRNWIPTLQGPIRKRNGSLHVAQAQSNLKRSRLIPYRIARTASFMLEFSENNINFFSAAGASLAVTISGPTPPWLEADLEEIQFMQQGDLLYLMHPDYPQHSLEYDGATSAVLTELQYDVGPLLPENVDTTIEILSSDDGSTTTAVTLTATNPVFTAAMVGQLIGFRQAPETSVPQWAAGTPTVIGDQVWSSSVETGGRINVYIAQNNGNTGTLAPGHDFGIESDGTVDWLMFHSDYGFVRINNFTSDTSVDGDIVGFPGLPASTITGSGTFRWALGAWGGANGYPRTGTFFQQRAVYGGTTAEPQKFWGSTVNAYEDFLPGLVSDSSAYQYVLSSDEANPIGVMLAGRNLFIGTAGGEFIATGGDIDTAITPTNISVRRDSRYGSAQQGALQVGESVIFVQSGRRNLREMAFNRDFNGYVANDMTLLSNHISALGMNKLGYQSKSDSIIWTYTDGGELIGITYERTQQVLGTHRHTLAGVVESVATLPDENGINDRVWLIVQRTINGVTKRYIEFINEDETNVWADSALKYVGPAVNTVSGLGVLEGEEVWVLADGAVRPNETVTAGQITIEGDPAEEIIVGLPMVADGESQAIEGGSEIGTSQGKSQRVHSIIMRLESSGVGLNIGTSFDRLVPVLRRNTEDVMDSPVPLFTGDTDVIPVDGGYSDDGTIVWRHNLPQPCIIVGMWPQMKVYDVR